VFEPAAQQLLGAEGPGRVVVTDSILPTRLVATDPARLVVLPASALFGEAIRRIVAGGSVVALRQMEVRPR
jgi:phosphoribosylpyrophosphate synthetase